jgi:hypothetical protein
MGTAQILYEQYKILPRKVKEELKTLIINEEIDIVEISLPALKKSIKQIELIKRGKLKTTSAHDFLKEIKEG